MIYVKNLSTEPVKVSVNKCGEEGREEYLALDCEDVKVWDLSDTHGFIFSVIQRGIEKSYSASQNSFIIIFDDHVQDSGTNISHLEK
ncbi:MULTISPECIES: hypothetical protein [Photorhabdus]|uniref:hypothetical protein n=1 Tax=Photorhabdus TaxID=29487 RepID=UPI000DCBDC13|nr:MULTISPECIES: hypothetical protein [Photorhabdus]MCT8343060.1 hypothetical protein [Photorhabdus kleinii]RAW95371.1 hypothetical protein CKY03_17845 [Photorhabdus sp. S9-53]RAW95526.1 hypothetical protein CKY05_17635 [Photorhabdus sp. S10-54]RAW99685.1 hypothetical protein CKY04_17610 [Photorhabdus sp. S8-52]